MTWQKFDFYTHNNIIIVAKVYVQWYGHLVQAIEQLSATVQSNQKKLTLHNQTRNLQDGTRMKIMKWPVVEEMVQDRQLNEKVITQGLKLQWFYLLFYKIN